MRHEHHDDDGRINPARMSERDLAELRQVTEKYKSFDFATHQGGYSHQITDCMTDPQLGGMGFHFGNDALIDGKPEKLAPEVLLFEPQKNGRMKFVAVEYIIPFPLWTDTVPPQLFGQNFKRNETFGVWALHAWIWKENPSGIFADWNPRVNCDFATM